jgi:phage-related protein
MRALPKAVRRNFGVALFAVQIGETPPTAKILRGFGRAGVLELMENDIAGTYRAIYTVRFASAIYVLHVFQKVQAGQRNAAGGHRFGQGEA